MTLQEETPVTTTANGGEPLVKPERPIGSFDKVKNLIRRKKETDALEAAKQK